MSISQIGHILNICAIAFLVRIIVYPLSVSAQDKDLKLWILGIENISLHYPGKGRTRNCRNTPNGAILSEEDGPELGGNEEDSKEAEVSPEGTDAAKTKEDKEKE